MAAHRIEQIHAESDGHGNLDRKIPQSHQRGILKGT